MKRVATVGVYRFSAEVFLARLREADVRHRLLIALEHGGRPRG